MGRFVFYLLGLITVAVFTDAASTKAKNLALRGRATQSSLVGGPWAPYADASNAIDGNTNAQFSAASCSHTDAQTHPWWRLDLLDEYTVTSIIITNRGDCCSERLTGAEIHIGNSITNNGNDNPLATVIPYIPAGNSKTFNLKEGFSGRYVNVMYPGDNMLTLCEVEVYGYPTPNGENLALKGRATQSSTFQYNYASNAIDGNRDGESSHGSCSDTSNESNPWWRLDLLKRHKVFSIVANRQDAYNEWLNGAEIRIGDNLENNGNNNPRCAVISKDNNKPTMTFLCKGMEGRYVNVVIPGGYRFITLCEVEVYGAPLI